MESIDRPIDPRFRLGRVVGDQVGHVLERQADRVEALDDAVVEVAADPQPLVDDRQLLDLLVEPGVLDRDAGVEREHLDELLVGVAELGGADLLGQVEVADRPPADADRNAEEGLHRRDGAAGSRTSPDAWRCPGSAG